MPNWLKKNKKSQSFLFICPDQRKEVENSPLLCLNCPQPVGLTQLLIATFSTHQIRFLLTTARVRSGTRALTQEKQYLWNVCLACYSLNTGQGWQQASGTILDESGWNGVKICTWIHKWFDLLKWAQGRVQHSYMHSYHLITSNKWYHVWVSHVISDTMNRDFISVHSTSIATLISTLWVTKCWAVKWSEINWL